MALACGVLAGTVSALPLAAALALRPGRGSMAVGIVCVGASCALLVAFAIAARLLSRDALGVFALAEAGGFLACVLVAAAVYMASGVR